MGETERDSYKYREGDKEREENERKNKLSV